MSNNKPNSIGCGCLLYTPFIIGMVFVIYFAITHPQIVRAFVALITTY